MSTPEDWPAAAPTLVNEPLDPPTLVGPALPPDVLPPGPSGEGPDDRFGMGMLLGLIVLGAVGVVAAAILLTRHQGNKQATPPTRTVYVTTAPSNSPSSPAKSRSSTPGVAVIVGTVLGETQATAVQALRGEGLGVRIVAVHGARPAGTVMGERPAAGSSVHPGATVLLLISDGIRSPALRAPSPSTKAPVTKPAQSKTVAATTTAAPAPVSQPTVTEVPDVSGNKLQAAVQSLNSAGFLASIAYVPGSDPLGTIVAQQPDGGSSALTGSHLTINASAGPGQKEQETVPDASGQTIPQAVSTLQHAHLRLIFVKKAVTDRSLAGKIVGQSPSKGATAPENAQVLVYMGAFR